MARRATAPDLARDELKKGGPRYGGSDQQRTCIASRIQRRRMVKSIAAGFKTERRDKTGKAGGNQNGSQGRRAGDLQNHRLAANRNRCPAAIVGLGGWSECKAIEGSDQHE